MATRRGTIRPRVLARCARSVQGTRHPWRVTTDSPPQTAHRAAKPQAPPARHPASTIMRIRDDHLGWPPTPPQSIVTDLHMGGKGFRQGIYRHPARAGRLVGSRAGSGTAASASFPRKAATKRLARRHPLGIPAPTGSAARAGGLSRGNSTTSCMKLLRKTQLSLTTRVVQVMVDVARHSSANRYRQTWSSACTIHCPWRPAFPPQPFHPGSAGRTSASQRQAGVGHAPHQFRHRATSLAGGFFVPAANPPTPMT